MSREPVDFIVHIPLEAEYIEFKKIFKVRNEEASDVNLVARVESPSGFSMVAIVQEKMGRSSAQAACHHILEKFDPKIYVCLGIAGGISKDMSLGDVCYTGNLIDVYDNSKITDVAGGGLDIALSPESYATNRKLTAALGFVRTMSSLSDLHDYWKEDQLNYVTNNVSGDVFGRDGEIESMGTPKCLNGYIVCGAVTESENYRSKLRGVSRNILAVETESGPIFEICGAKVVEVITIRGISDYANASKGELEGSTKDAVRAAAARSAASFFHMQLQSPVFIEAIASVCGPNAGEMELDLQKNPASYIPDAIEKISKEVDSKLRELSPQYKTKPIGFKLPSPRVKREEGAAVADPKKRPKAQEFALALAKHRHMLIYVPRTYPDQALPWILASSLLHSDITGKKAIPIVIDGRRLGPPKDNLEHLSSIVLSNGIDQDGGEYIFIVDEPQFGSKTKISFLQAEAKRFENARFVFVTRNEKENVQTQDFQRALFAESFSLHDVSFSEMAAFLQTAYAMPSHEADVVAYKLKGMFNRFSLPAHPSFFAGISPEALASLLAANRRSELIQLAVDGLLSFVVASDKDVVRMSRTNRTKFLRRLAVELSFEKRKFSHSELVQYAKSISDEYDYGLNPLSFVNSFVEAGLIHFENDEARITLPFVESYLFADELSKNATLAKRYVAAIDRNIDLLVFDLYSELGPSEDCIKHVMGSISKLVDEFAIPNEEHVLIQNTINPAVFKNKVRLSSLGRQISDARSAVATGASDRVEKARILDIAERVNEGIASETESGSDEKSEEVEAVDKIVEMLHQWNIATILLGSGAETINGADRKELVKHIIHCGEVLMERMLNHVLSIDFDDVKRKVLADEEFKKGLAIENDAMFEKQVGSLVDVVEFMALSSAVDWMFDHLPDRAKHKIVGNSIAKAEVDGPIQNLIKLSWLTNINPAEGRSELIKVIQDLPHAHFLRATITSIFILRVKWKLSDERTRLALLDAAEVAIRPFNPNLNKGEIARFVKSTDPIKISDDDDMNGK